MIAMLIVAMAFVSFNSYAQLVEETQAGVTVVSAFTLTETAFLNFGTVSSTSGTLGGDVSLSAETAIRTATGPVNLVPTDPGHQATYDLVGPASHGYQYSFGPLPVTLTHTGGTHTLQLTALEGFSTNSGATNMPFLDGTGVDVLSVGGTLGISANAMAGYYEGTFSLIVVNQ